MNRHSETATSSQEQHDSISTLIENSVLDIKQEPDDPEYVNIKDLENASNFELFEIAKTEIEEEILSTDQVGSSSDYNNEQMMIPFDNFWSQVGFSDSHREDKTLISKIDIKKEDTDSQLIVKEDTAPEYDTVDIEILGKNAAVIDETWNSHDFPSGNGTDTAEVTKWYQCEYCETKTKSKYLMECHVKMQHKLETEWYRCGLCEFKTKDAKDIMNHFQEQHDAFSKWFQCKICEYKTKSGYNFEVHSVTEHNLATEWYQCQLCDFKTKYRLTLDTHVKTKHDSFGGMYKCRYCKYRTPQREELGKHIKMKHNDDIKWYRCQFCQFRSEYKVCLATHVKLAHSKKGIWYKCTCCKYTTKNKCHLERHRTTHGKKDGGEELYDCGLCGFKTTRKDVILGHFQHGHDAFAKWQQCGKCNFRTKSDDDFEYHRNMAHE